MKHYQIAAILSYFVIGLIWYLVDEEIKKSHIAKFHVKQALNIFIISFGFSFIYTYIITPIINAILPLPVFGFIFAGVISLLFGIIGITLLVIWIVGVLNAIQSETKPVPIIGKFAKKYLKF